MEPNTCMHTYVYVCRRVCLHTYVYVCRRVCLRARKWTNECVSVRQCMSACFVSASLPISARVHVGVCVRVCVRVCVCVCVGACAKETSCCVCGSVRPPFGVHQQRCKRPCGECQRGCDISRAPKSAERSRCSDRPDAACTCVRVRVRGRVFPPKSGHAKEARSTRARKRVCVSPRELLGSVCSFVRAVRACARVRVCARVCVMSGPILDHWRRC